MPTEIHRHYNAEGEQVGWTEIVRESPWTDNARATAEALFDADEHLICPKCGNPREVCSDPNRPWYPQRSVCYASATQEAFDWKFRERHRQVKRTLDEPMLPTDGVHVWTSREDLTPDDDFV